MSAKRASISQVMLTVALTAVNLALLRATPIEILAYPTVWVLAGSIDLVIFWKLIQKRSLRAFHYTFLVVFIVTFLVTAICVATERIAPLGLLVRLYQQVAHTNTIGLSRRFLWIAEIWMACLSSFILACAMGLAAAWLEANRGWDIAAVWRGALVGLGIVTLLLTLIDVADGRGPDGPVGIPLRLVVLGIGVLLGGKIGLSSLKSDMPG
jgi:hypothetical protein